MAGALRTFLPLVLATAGCVSSSAVPLGGEHHPPRATDHPIVVFDTVADVGRPFHKVAPVVGEGSSSASFAAIVQSMFTDPRAAGADALVLTGGGLLSWGTDEDGNPCLGKTVNGLAIRWQDR